MERKQTVQWTDLEHLRRLEFLKIVKPSKLTDAAISSKLVERQRISTCLHVFLDETLPALNLTVNLLISVKVTFS